MILTKRRFEVPRLESGSDLSDGLWASLGKTTCITGFLCGEGCFFMSAHIVRPSGIRSGASASRTFRFQNSSARETAHAAGRNVRAAKPGLLLNMVIPGPKDHCAAGTDERCTPAHFAAVDLACHVGTMAAGGAGFYCPFLQQCAQSPRFFCAFYEYQRGVR